MQNKTCAIFGGNGAIGAACGEALALHNWNITTISRRPAGKALNESFKHIQGDVTNQSCVSQIAAEIGSVDAVIYAVGLPADIEEKLADTSYEAWHATFSTYLFGFFYVLKSFLPILPAGAHILAISSAITRFRTSTLPPFHAGSYASAKAALDELCKWARRDAHERKLLLSRLSPSAVESPTFQVMGRFGATALPLQFVSGRICRAILESIELDEVMTNISEG